MTNTIEFEGLGLGPWKISRVAFSVFGMNIYWYAIIITTGIILSLLFACNYGKKWGITSDNIIDTALWCIIPAIIGARIYYVIFSLNEYMVDGKFSWARAINIRDGGLGLYGSVIVGFLMGALMCKIKHVNMLALFDVGAVSFTIGQFVGRWGNFMNAEAHGYETSLPWGMKINGTGPFHPTFLYESLWNFVGFGLLLLYGKYLKKRDGELFLGYFIWYGIGRALVEGLRTDSLYIGNSIIRVSQLLGIIFAVVGLILLILLRKGVFDKVLVKKENIQPVCKDRSIKHDKQVSEYSPLFTQKSDCESSSINNDNNIVDKKNEEIINNDDIKKE